MVENEKKLVAIIDDDEVITTLMTALLGDDYIVKVFNNPMEGIAEAPNMKPAAILLDVNMPNIDGMEVLKQLRRHPQTGHIPIISISGDNNMELRDRLDEYGSIGFIRKPIDPKNFKSLVTSYLDIVNKTVSSEDGHSRCILAHSVSEKYRLFYRSLLSQLNAGENVLVISWRGGEELDLATYGAFLDSGQLVWLEIKPIANVKMPYLTNLTPIIDDIDRLAGGTSGEYQLYFDDLKNLFNLQDKQRSVSKVAELGHLFRMVFKSRAYYLSRPMQRDEQETVHKMIQLLIGYGA